MAGLVPMGIAGWYTWVMMITRALVACSAVAVLATACTSSSGSGPSSVPSSTGSASVTAASSIPSSTAPSTPGPRTTAKPSSSAAAGPSACTGTQLTVGHAAPSGATGHSGVVVIFLNESTKRCTLIGYPGAAVLDSSGAQIEQAKRTKSGFLGGCGCTPRTVTLGPGDKASALVEGDVGGGDECLRGRALLVTPPNTKKSTRIAFADYSCDVQVHPAVAGTSGGVRH